MVAVSAAMRISEARASSVPPPRATPLTAAITGMEAVRWIGEQIPDGQDELFDLILAQVALSFRSAPAQKAFGHRLPVMMRHPDIALVGRRASIWHPFRAMQQVEIEGIHHRRAG
jgi:hypothetical protein